MSGFLVWKSEHTEKCQLEDEKCHIHAGAFYSSTPCHIYRWSCMNSSKEGTFIWQSRCACRQQQRKHEISVNVIQHYTDVLQMQISALLFQCRWQSTLYSYVHTVGCAGVWSQKTCLYDLVQLLGAHVYIILVHVDRKTMH